MRENIQEYEFKITVPSKYEGGHYIPTPEEIIAGDPNIVIPEEEDISKEKLEQNQN